MGSRHGLLDAGGELLGPGEVVVPVALGIWDPQRRDDGEILQQRNRRDVREILCAHLQGHLRGEPPPMRNQASIRDALEDAFAVLVARPDIAPSQGDGQGSDCTFGLIDNDRRPVAPCEQLLAGFLRVRHVAMKRLLHEQQALHEAGELLVREQPFPECPESGNGLVVLISIQGELAGLASERPDLVHPVAIACDVPGELDLQQPQVVHAQALLQRLRETIQHALACRNVRSSQWIGKADVWRTWMDSSGLAGRYSAGSCPANSG